MFNFEINDSDESIIGMLVVLDTYRRESGKMLNEGNILINGEPATVRYEGYYDGQEFYMFKMSEGYVKLALNI